jgi:hypothetical protein
MNPRSLFGLCSLPSALILLTCIVCAAPFARAQYTIGSSTVAVADPPISRPTTKPCVVNLFTNDVFDNYSNMPFNFKPPAACPGPYSKIVLGGSYYITSGVQFDRTSQVFLKGVNIFFGTTPEPINVNDPWYFERDLTDYAGLFKTAGTGFASLGNTVNSTYTGVIYGTVDLFFYPADANNPPAANQADYVAPLMALQGGSVQLNANAPEFRATGTVPNNLERLYVDIIAQSQNEEEQWFTCLPTNDDTLSIDGCPNTAFREVEVTIDGKPAGVAPVSPWIYTGGLDPYLWLPIPGAQTLNFTPYRVDLSPFAGYVSDSKPHTIGIELFNAFEYFTVTAALVGYEDTAPTSGSILSNDLGLPGPSVTENLNQDASGNITGSVEVLSNRSYTIVGEVNTSHGRVIQAVEANILFSNNSAITDTATVYEQAIQQDSSVQTIEAGYDTVNGGLSLLETNWAFPINISLTQIANSDGSFTQTTKSQQQYSVNTSDEVSGLSQSMVSNTMSAQDALSIVPCSGGYCIGGNSGQQSSQTYIDTNFVNQCYYQAITAANNELSSAVTLPGCSSKYGSAANATADPKPSGLPTLTVEKLEGAMLRAAQSHVPVEPR